MHAPLEIPTMQRFPHCIHIFLATLYATLRSTHFDVTARVAAALASIHASNLLRADCRVLEEVFATSQIEHSSYGLGVFTAKVFVKDGIIGEYSCAPFYGNKNATVRVNRHLGYWHFCVFPRKGRKIAVLVTEIATDTSQIWDQKKAYVSFRSIAICGLSIEKRMYHLQECKALRRLEREGRWPPTRPDEQFSHATSQKSQTSNEKR